jgi:hypothetical protein
MVKKRDLHQRVVEYSEEVEQIGTLCVANIEADIVEVEVVVGAVDGEEVVVVQEVEDFRSSAPRVDEQVQLPMSQEPFEK